MATVGTLDESAGTAAWRNSATTTKLPFIQIEKSTAKQNARNKKRFLAIPRVIKATELA